MKTEFGRVAIAGLGLIGGSIAAGLKQRGLAEVVAWDSDPGCLKTGLNNGVIDEALTTPEACAEADILVLAVPVRALSGVMSKMPAADQIITDVGSVKQFVIETVRDVYGHLPERFVPGHPIAGSERHGVTAANPNLFENHRVILTPAEVTDDKARQHIEDLWRALGADVLIMSPDHHDSVLAQTSHLPHLLAYGLVDTLSAGGDSMEVFQYAAGGFRDFSRIAASDPVMWRDVFLTNPVPVLEVLDRYVAELGALRESIAAGDGETLQKVFERAKTARDHFSEIDKQRES